MRARKRLQSLQAGEFLSHDFQHVQKTIAEGSEPSLRTASAPVLQAGEKTPVLLEKLMKKPVFMQSLPGGSGKFAQVNSIHPSDLSKNDKIFCKLFLYGTII